MMHLNAVWGMHKCSCEIPRLHPFQVHCTSSLHVGSRGEGAGRTVLLLPDAQRVAAGGAVDAAEQRKGLRRGDARGVGGAQAALELPVGSLGRPVRRQLRHCAGSEGAALGIAPIAVLVPTCWECAHCIERTEAQLAGAARREGRHKTRREQRRARPPYTAPNCHRAKAGRCAVPRAAGGEPPRAAA